MDKLRKLAVFSFVLCTLSALAFFALHLALHDIYHGEDEWNVIYVASLAIALFHVSAWVTLAKMIDLDRPSAGG